MKIDFTPRAVYRGQIRVLEHALNVKRVENDDLRASIRTLNDEISRLIAEAEQHKIISKNIIDKKRKEIRDLEKEVNRLRLELNNEFDKTCKPIEAKPVQKPKFNRAKNGRFAAKQVD